VVLIAGSAGLCVYGWVLYQWGQGEVIAAVAVVMYRAGLRR